MKLSITFILLLFITISFIQRGTSQTAPCTYTSGGTKYDFTKLAGKDISVSAGGYTYDLNICGTSSTECPNDPDGVTSGMAVQTKPSPFGGACYVLGQYDDSVTTANWSPLSSPAGVALTLANGSPSDCPEGTPRQLALNLECGTATEDTAWTIDDGGDCSYTIHYKTCYACAKGCAGGGGGGGGGGGTPGEMTFFEIFFIVFISSLCVYCIGGVIFNVYKMERKGTEAIPNKQFWGALPGYVKDGFVFTGETTVNVVNRLRGQGGGGGGNLDYRPASPDTESYQGNDDGTFEKA